MKNLAYAKPIMATGQRMSGKTQKHPAHGLTMPNAMETDLAKLDMQARSVKPSDARQNLLPIDDFFTFLIERIHPAIF